MESTVAGRVMLFRLSQPRNVPLGMMENLSPGHENDCKPLSRNTSSPSCLTPVGMVNCFRPLHW